MASVHVLAPGMLTTVQDRGRWGWQHLGVPVAGPMDPYAHRFANALVGNSAGAAALEVTLVGPRLRFDDERIAAATGAEFELLIDDRPQAMNTPLRVGAGSVFRFGRRSRGARAYLAIEGGIAVPPVLSSRSTHLPSRMGGLDGRALRAGDRLPLGPVARRSLARRAPSQPRRPLVPAGPPTVRVLPGPHRARLAADALDLLQSAPYTLDVSSNRMGYRLHGPRLAHALTTEMLSDATTIGAIQVPAGGEPILLMADRQTTGGYPILATVISADLGVAGQLAPGESVSFAVTTFPVAMSELIAGERELLALEDESVR